MFHLMQKVIIMQNVLKLINQELNRIINWLVLKNKKDFIIGHIQLKKLFSTYSVACISHGF